MHLKLANVQVASCQVLQKKLVAEKKVRKASEQWLKAELKSRVSRAVFATV